MIFGKPDIIGCAIASQ